MIKFVKKYFGLFLVLNGLVSILATLTRSLPDVSYSRWPMPLSSAVCFALLGLVYDFSIVRSLRKLAPISISFLGLCCLISLGTLWGYLFQVPAGTGQLVAVYNAGNNALFPVRMSLVSCLSFLFCSISFAVIIYDIRKLRRFSQVLNHLVLLVSATTILCFFYGVEDEIIRWKVFFMSLHATILFFLLSIMLSVLIPEHGLTRILYFKPLARRAAIAFTINITIMMVFVGYLDVYLVKYDILSSEFSSVITRIISIAAIIIVIWLTATRLNRVEEKQLEATKMIVDLNSELEFLVARINRLRHFKDDPANAGTTTPKLDIRELIVKAKGLVNELRSKNELLEDFAHLISHNLRTPIANLSSLLEMYDVEENEDSRNQILGDCKSALKDMFAMLDGMLEALKLDSSHPTSEVVFYQNVLEKMFHTLNIEIVNVNAKINTDFSKNVSVKYPLIYLESIVLNILTNALKYRSPDRQPIVSLESFMLNGRPVLKVTDNGIGMDLKKVGKDLFGLFKTFNSNPDAKGLGLYMTKKQVEKMGGKIEVDSQVNVGTTFTITLL